MSRRSPRASGSRHKCEHNSRRALICLHIRRPYSPLRRECRMFSAALYARVQLFCTILHTRPRVQRASGIPCSLFGETTICKPRAIRAARRRTCICCLESTPEVHARHCELGWISEPTLMNETITAVVARLDRATRYSRDGRVQPRSRGLLDRPVKCMARRHG